MAEREWGCYGIQETVTESRLGDRESGDGLFVSLDEAAEIKHSDTCASCGAVSEIHTIKESRTNSPCTQNALTLMALSGLWTQTLLEPPLLKTGTHGISLDKSTHKIMCATLCTKKQKGHIRADGPCMSLLTWYEVIALIMVWLSLSLLTHTEKFVFVFFFFGPELQENWLFDFVSHGSETSVRPATSEASLLSDDVVLKWAGTLDNCVLVFLCACMCVCHAFYISVLIQVLIVSHPCLFFMF